MKVGDWVGAFDVEVDEIGEEVERGEEEAELEVEVEDVLVGDVLVEDVLVGDVLVGVDTGLVLGGIGAGDAMLGQSALSISPPSTAPSKVNGLTITAPHACFTESPVFRKPAVQAVEHGPGLKSARWQLGMSAL